MFDCITDLQAFKSDGPKLAKQLGASSLDVVTSNPNLSARVSAVLITSNSS